MKRVFVPTALTRTRSFTAWRSRVADPELDGGALFGFWQRPGATEASAVTVSVDSVVELRRTVAAMRRHLTGRIETLWLLAPQRVVVVHPEGEEQFALAWAPLGGLPRLPDYLGERAATYPVGLEFRR